MFRRIICTQPGHAAVFSLFTFGLEHTFLSLFSLAKSKVGIHHRKTGGYLAGKHFYPKINKRRGSNRHNLAGSHTHTAHTDTKKIPKTLSAVVIFSLLVVAFGVK